MSASWRSLLLLTLLATPASAYELLRVDNNPCSGARNLSWSDANAAVNEIAKVGPGGSFLSQPSTLKNYKSGYYVSGTYPRYSMEKWMDAGSPPARQVLREKTQDLMASAKAPEEYDEFVAKGEEFIRQRFHDIL